MGYSGSGQERVDLVHEGGRLSPLSDLVQARGALGTGQGLIGPWRAAGRSLALRAGVSREAARRAL